VARRTRRTHAPAFKAKVALADIKGEKTLAELAQHYDVHPKGVGAFLNYSPTPPILPPEWDGLRYRRRAVATALLG
jgi:hypothetical protein